MSEKYYAVREGRKTGIFTDWNEVKKYVIGYSSAKYKSFSSLQEAENFMNVDNKKHLSSKLDLIQAYVDGSFSEEKEIYSFGVVLLSQENVIQEIFDIGNDSSLISMRNVAGEIVGAMTAIKWAYENNFEQIEVYYDYMGIEMWATGDWKAKKMGTQKYVDFINLYKNRITITFKKVKAHSGIKYNERADKLAAEAMSVKSSSLSTINEEAEEINPYINIFNEVMSKTNAEQNTTTFLFRGVSISEKKLENFVKSCWKYDGNRIKNLKQKLIELNVDNGTLSWTIIDDKEKKYSFSLKI